MPATPSSQVVAPRRYGSHRSTDSIQHEVVEIPGFDAGAEAGGRGRRRVWLTMIGTFCSWRPYVPRAWCRSLAAMVSVPCCRMPPATEQPETMLVFTGGHGVPARSQKHLGDVLDVPPTLRLSRRPGGHG